MLPPGKLLQPALCQCYGHNACERMLTVALLCVCIAIIQHFALVVQTSVASLEDEQMLAQVLRHVNSLKDIARCSAVSRSWHAASQAVQLLSIAMDTGDRQLTSDNAATVLQKFQLCEARGMFRQLQQIYLAVGAYSPHFVRQGSTTSFFLSVVKVMSSGPQMANISSSWPLRSCHLSGVFPLIPAVLCLPVTVKHVILEPDFSTCPGYVHLHVFSRFVNLQTLEIRAKGSLADRGRTSFLLDCVLGSLQTMYLLDRGVLVVCDGFSLGTSLPTLRHFGAALNSFNARALLALPELKFAALHVTNAKWVQFSVEPSSTLEVVLVDLHTTSVIGKAGVKVGALVECVSLCPFNLCNRH